MSAELTGSYDPKEVEARWYDIWERSGSFRPEVNPDGQVATPGYLYEVKNIPDFNKTADTRLELVGVITI